MSWHHCHAHSWIVLKCRSLLTELNFISAAHPSSGSEMKFQSGPVAWRTGIDHCVGTACGEAPWPESCSEPLCSQWWLQTVKRAPCAATQSFLTLLPEGIPIVSPDTSWHGQEVDRGHGTTTYSKLPCWAGFWHRRQKHMVMWSDK